MTFIVGTTLTLPLHALERNVLLIDCQLLRRHRHLEHHVHEREVCTQALLLQRPQLLEFRLVVGQSELVVPSHEVDRCIKQRPLRHSSSSNHPGQLPPSSGGFYAHKSPPPLSELRPVAPGVDGFTLQPSTLRGYGGGCVDSGGAPPQASA